MREVGIFAASEGLEDSFDDIKELSRSCRFGNCSHANEPGCAVLQAIKSGKMQQERYGNYVKLKKESALNETSSSDKRKKKEKSAKNRGNSGVKHK